MANTTKFALKPCKITMHDGMEFEFWFDGNGKITVGNGTFENPTANSFSLVQKDDCPFATPICKKACYVNRLEEAEVEVHNKFKCNSISIREILENPSYREKAMEVFAEWIYTNCQNGFRWHVSGDIFSMEYARFIECVSGKTQILSWLYTRSFEYLEPIARVKNLIVNLSADEDNFAEALKVHEEFGFRICYMTIDGKVPSRLPEGSVIFPSYELRGRDLPDPKQAPWWQSLSMEERRMVCPPDFFGQSEKLRCGPCTKCLV